jgi:AhpD family alkylhydroperoxidase
VTAFAIHTIDTAPEHSRETLRHVRESLGMIPNLAAAMAESPTLVRAFFTVRAIYAEGSLSPIDIQVLSLTNAFENGCAWCMAFHSAGALKDGLSRQDLALLRAGQATPARFE